MSETARILLAIGCFLYFLIGLATADALGDRWKPVLTILLCLLWPIPVGYMLYSIIKK